MSKREQWIVYRCYGAENDLLYVGVTGYLPHRMAIHRLQSPWFGEMRRTETVPCADKAAAYALEASAIQAEHPRHNILTNQGKVRKSLSIAPSLAQAVDELAAEQGHNNFSAVVIRFIVEGLNRLKDVRAA